ncbi:MAG: hypothetical protein V1736_03175, partial [Pseudomonadota bacterium]
GTRPNIHEFEAHSVAMQRKFGDIWAVPSTSAVDHPESDRLLDTSAAGTPAFYCKLICEYRKACIW